MSNLVEHAKRELEILGEEPETIKGYLKVVQAFADMGHSGGSASVAVPTLLRLLQFENLKPLTNDPDEWFYHSPETWGDPSTGAGIWQNIRNPEAFSDNNGKTYWLVSDKKRKLHYGIAKELK